MAADPFLIEVCCSFYIFFKISLFQMMSPIDFYGQMGFAAVEVQNVIINGVLTAEF